LPRQEKLKVVLDTNVIISAALARDSNPSRVFELLLLERVDNFTSLEITDEIKDVFSRPKIKDLTSPAHRDFIIDNFVRLSKSIKPRIKLDVVKEDKADNKFLEAALESKADFVVSGDKHLLNIREFRGTKIVSPKEFLDRL